MIRIAVSKAAYAAIAAGDLVPRELPETTASGKVFVDRLVAARRPGEDYSATILRIAAEVATLI